MKNELSLALFVVGAFFLFNSKTNITGAVTGFSVSYGFGSLVGAAFIIAAIVLLASGETRRIKKTIDDLIELGVSKKKIDSIQQEVKSHYRRMSKEQRRGIYKEIADIMEDVKEGERSGGTYNLHALTSIPSGVERTVLAKKLLVGDAKVLSRYLHQGGRGTERYVFDNNTGELLGIAYHPGGKSKELRWRVRF